MSGFLNRLKTEIVNVLSNNDDKSKKSNGPSLKKANSQANKQKSQEMEVEQDMKKSKSLKNKKNIPLMKDPQTLVFNDLEEDSDLMEYIEETEESKGLIAIRK